MDARPTAPLGVFVYSIAENPSLSLNISSVMYGKDGLVEPMRRQPRDALCRQSSHKACSPTSVSVCLPLSLLPPPPNLFSLAPTLSPSFTPPPPPIIPALSADA